MIKRFFAIAMVLSLILSISCGGQTDTNLDENLPVTKSTPENVVESGINLDDYDNLLVAYNIPGLDKTFTPLELYESAHGKQVDKTLFPLVLPVFIDEDNNAVAVLGHGGKAMLIDRYVIVSSVVTKFPELDSRDLPPPLRGTHPGLMLVFDVSPSGDFISEVLDASLAKNEKLGIEIFKRNSNSIYPFPKSMPFELGSMEDISLADSVVFYGYTSGIQGEYSLTEKRGAVSAIDLESGIFRINGSATVKDPGSPLFTLDCGRQKLSGIVLGSFANTGRESETFVAGINKVAEFFEQETGVAFKTKEPESLCKIENPKLTGALVEKMSDGEYDASFDVAHLKGFDFEDAFKWVRPFEGVIVNKQNPDVISSLGTALLIDDYAVVSASAVKLDPSHSDVHRYRIVWGDLEKGGLGNVVEYVEFAGYDSTKSVALFRRTDTAQFPIPKGLELKIGSSMELKNGVEASVLYAFGFFSISDSERISNGANPLAVVSKVSQENAERAFYFQGSISEHEAGAPIFAFRDGELELVGLSHGPMNSSESETLGQALTVEFMLNAVEEIKCANSNAACGVTKSTDFYEPQPRMPEIAAKIVVIASGKDKDGNDKEELKTGEATILSGKYVITSSELFPRSGRLVQGNFEEDKSDIRANTIRIADNDISIRILMFRDFLYLDEIGSLSDMKVDEYDETYKMEILKVILVDRENGYALLERGDPKLGVSADIPIYQGLYSDLDFITTHLEIISENGKPRFVEVTTHGRVTYSRSANSAFIFSGFVHENLGAPVHDRESGKLIGIISRGDPEFAKQINTEGFGLSMQFIKEKIKQKTGINIF
ncbi:MAG: hypothetical protein A3B96_04300 [Candidatus Spechtbacteria bacterium RIFCSPHIGHO2_02_FULL_43_15b]|uniref:Serine protease n=1 Tax=Candidatus Spechtbacteria bacterium RIFCSPHIGHO2_01_FULL_43_30 TaxID=1802158 RepID=A0A1G2H7I4_9BACT|nr:MAG: hypothetical protein A2827_01865 [Candidatus Spechtbacteria bacterium RIFCSPHIGHO2_01_FULL_43_30]OGZ58556.1 MAG: hypothetical protein A3B96_04300 [Candidatus Spechtbacteria bacterium RIFCSPHIGHO2_02_FULL_43_15b]